MDTKSEVIERPNATAVAGLKGNLAFNNVTFAYGETAVLKNLSFTADCGTMVALVGETGSGKTTIGALIARLYELEHGSITIDGIDIRDMTLESLRNHVSVVFQDVFLFNGTIAENIKYGAITPPEMDDVIRVAKSAQIHDFIDGLADKYETQNGERGVRLSGGHKQRLAIARALLRNCPILILDEATSSIDNLTEQEIQRAIEKICADKTKTIIVIAHRLSTIEKADKILVLDRGTISESGTHAQLLKNAAAYAKLYRHEKN
jgi:ABC-type multidrug transport system fused ATPase/permease subunit